MIMVKILQLIIIGSLIHINYFSAKHKADNKAPKKAPTENKSIVLDNIVKAKDLSNIINLLKEGHKVNLTLKDGVDIETEDFENFIKNLYELKTKNITVNITNLKKKSYKFIVSQILENLVEFNELELGLIDENDIHIMEKKIEKEQLNIIPLIKKEQRINNKLTLFHKFNFVNSENNISTTVSYELSRTQGSTSRTVINSNDMDIDDIDKLIAEIVQQEKNPKKSRAKKESNSVIQRINLLMESKELDKDVEKGIQNLLDKINQRGSNPNNETEKVKYMDILTTIAKMFILNEEDISNKRHIINELIDLHNNNKISNYNSKKIEMNKKIFEILIPSKSSKVIVEELLRILDAIILIKIYNRKNGNKIKENPPMRSSLLISGPPGVGKTSTATQFAKLFNIPVVTLNAGEEKKYFTGGLPIYANSAPGAIAKALENHVGGMDKVNVNKGTRTIMFILDEVDKYAKEAQESLLALLDNSQKFFDQHLEIPLTGVDECFFVLTANDITKVIEPLRDRCRVVKVDKLTIAEKKELARRNLLKGLKFKFPEKEIKINPEALNLIVNKSEGAGARQVQSNVQNVINYITDNYIDSNVKIIEVTEKIIGESLHSIDFAVPNIIANESKVGYINGIVLLKKNENYKEEKYYSPTNISCSASNDFNNQHIIFPIDHHLQTIPQFLSRIITTYLNTVSLSNKNMIISPNASNIDPEGHRSLSSLIFVGWVSAVMGRPIKSNSTIIAELLSSGDVEFDPKTVYKIQMAYNAGLKKIVIGSMDGTTKESVIKIFNLKLKKSEKDKEIYYHDIENKREDAIYPELEICIIKNIKDAVDYLVVKN